MTYFGRLEFIEYRTEQLLIIISTPHWGQLKLNSILDRECDECVYILDSNSEKLLRDMYAPILDKSFSTVNNI